MTSASGWLLDVNGEHCSKASSSRAILTWSLTPVPQPAEGREDSPSVLDKPVCQVERLVVCSHWNQAWIPLLLLICAGGSRAPNIVQLSFCSASLILSFQLSCVGTSPACGVQGEQKHCVPVIFQ